MIFVTEQVIEGLDRAVMSMKKGEIALVTIPPEYAFSFTESKQELAVVPANSTVIYEVELVSFVKVSSPSHPLIFDCRSLVLDRLMSLIYHISPTGERIMGHEHRRED